MCAKQETSALFLMLLGYNQTKKMIIQRMNDMEHEIKETGCPRITEPGLSNGNQHIFSKLKKTFFKTRVVSFPLQCCRTGILKFH